MKFEKVEKLIANLHDTKERVTHIINLKQALKNGLVLKRVQKESQSLAKIIHWYEYRAQK